MKEIKLTKGKVAFVDDEDFERVNQYRWCYDRGYAIRSVTIAPNVYKPLFMHRFIMNTPDNLRTDHRDHNGLNNQKYNLRVCTNSQNLRNSRPYRKSTSRFKGVSIKIDHKRYPRYRAAILVDGKRFEKCFPFTIEGERNAALWYNEMAVKHFGEFAYLNPL